MQWTQSALLGSRADVLYKYFTESLSLPGDIAECGVYDGITAANLVQYLEENKVDKTVHLFDTFTGLPDLLIEDEKQFKKGMMEKPLWVAKGNLKELSRYEIYEGLFSETFKNFNRPLCFIHADADLYVSTKEIIELADRLLVEGGVMVFDDYGIYPWVTSAVDQFLSKEYILEPPTGLNQLVVKMEMK